MLVTGATGYVGGLLVPALLDAGYPVRALVRDPSRLGGRSWARDVDVLRGDLLDEEIDSLVAAMKGVHTAFYLVHSMRGGAGYRERDLAAARRFARAARSAAVQRIVYLGGLGDAAGDLSQHLRSRQETGEELARHGPSVTEFRAAIVVGAGSVSFEMIRYLTERLPVMICPLWVYTRVQPIAAADLIDYLVASLAAPESAGRIIEIGGADVLTYGEMMTGYARARGLRRHLQPVPVLTPRLSSYWVHLVTPIPSTVAQPLIEGLRSEVVVHDDLAARLFPAIRPIGYDQAVRAALASLDAGQVPSSWSDALASTGGSVEPFKLVSDEGMLLERRQRIVEGTPHEVFEVFSRVGGDWKWPYADPLWRARGAIDRLAGGVGMRRGRRDLGTLRPGDALDFWRVEAVERDHLLRLRAEMKTPGRAWLQFEAEPAPGPAGSAGPTTSSHSLLTQTAFFAPRGLAGLAYWYGLYPVHSRIFSGMVDELARRAALVSQIAC